MASNFASLRLNAYYYYNLYKIINQAARIPKTYLLHYGMSIHKDVKAAINMLNRSGLDETVRDCLA